MMLRNIRSPGLMDNALSLWMMWFLCWQRLVLSSMCRLKFSLISSVIPRYLKLSTISPGWLSMFMGHEEWLFYGYQNGVLFVSAIEKEMIVLGECGVCMLWMSAGVRGEQVWQCHQSILKYLVTGGALRQSFV